MVICSDERPLHFATYLSTRGCANEWIGPETADPNLPHKSNPRPCNPAANPLSLKRCLKATDTSLTHSVKTPPQELQMYVQEFL